MDKCTDLKKRLCLPDISQVGIVVRDMDRAIEYYENILGLGPFVRLDIKFDDVQYHG
jgi:catechol 2,3-dioxygenase-like lactoylglutathione lyase family enzyme